MQYRMLSGSKDRMCRKLRLPINFWRDVTCQMHRTLSQFGFQ